LAAQPLSVRIKPFAHGKRTDMPTLQQTNMTVRPVRAQDAAECGRIFYDAFASIATRHNLPIEPSSPEYTAFHVANMLADDSFAGVVAERDGLLVGCAFADEGGEVCGIGPVCVDPQAQDAGTGRALMQALLERERDRGASAIRLVQTAYHYRSLALYAKLGFAVREPLSVLQGDPSALAAPAGHEVRAAVEADIAACAELCTRVHGFDRSAELRRAIAAGWARVAERDGHICAYATAVGYAGHAVADDNAALLAMLAQAGGFLGLGILVPSRNVQLLRACLDGGLRIVQQSTLMTVGPYEEPAGAWLPSILY
jgi:predicted N-acetyltransferase YhbS